MVALASTPDAPDPRIKVATSFARTPLTLPERHFESQKTANRAEFYAVISTLLGQGRSTERATEKTTRGSFPRPL